MRRARRARVSQGVRALGAAAFVAALIVGTVAIDRTLESPAVSVMAKAAALVAPDAADGVDGAEGLSAEAVETFEAELFALDGLVDVRATSDGRVVGFAADADAASAYRSVADRLVAAGWVEVGSGVAHAGSFVKEEGDLRWALVSCTGFGDSSSVVVQCA